MGHGVKQRVLAVLLVVVFVCGSAFGVFAQGAQGRGGSAEENASLLEQLRELSPALTEEELLEQLQQLGVLDETGQVDVQEYLLVDGVQMTLDEVAALLESPDADPTATVDVGGVTTTLGDLAVTLAIEEYLAYLQEAYFSEPVEATEEHLAAQEDLLQQLESEGIEVVGLEAVDGAYIDVVVDAQTFEADASPQMLQFYAELVDANGAPFTQVTDEAVTLQYRVLPGSAMAGLHYSANNNTGTLTIPAGATRSDVVAIDINRLGDYYDVGVAESRWYGTRSFVLQLHDPANAPLYTQRWADATPQTASIPITLTSAYQWPTQDTPGHVDVGTRLVHRYPAGANDVSNTMKTTKPMAFNTPYNFYVVSDKADTNRFDILHEDGIAIKDRIIMDGQVLRDYTISTVILFNPYQATDALMCNAFVSCGSTRMSDDFQNTFTNNNIPASWWFQRKEIGPFYMPAGLPYTDVHLAFDFSGDLREYSMELYHTDKLAPQIVDATVPALAAGQSYSNGQMVPITVEFSEPVRLGYNGAPLCARLVDGTGQNAAALTLLEDTASISKQATFLYAVPATGEIGDITNLNLELLPYQGTTIMPKDISGLEIGRESAANYKTQVSIPLQTDALATFDALSADVGDCNDNAPITLTMAMVPDTNWIKVPSQYDVDGITLRKVFVKAENSGLSFPLVAVGEGAAQGDSFTASISAETTTRIYDILAGGQSPPGDVTETFTVYLKDPTEQAVANCAANVVIHPTHGVVQQVTGAALSAGVQEPRTLYLDSAGERSIEYVLQVSPERNAATVAWSTSNGAVGSITQAAENPLSATAHITQPGQVQFTATVTDPLDGNRVHTLSSPVYTVRAYEDRPQLSFGVAAADGTYRTIEGVGQQVGWEDSVTATLVDALYRLEVFEGQYASAADIPVDAVRVCDESLSGVTDYHIPADVLEGGKVYTLRVTLTSADGYDAAAIQPGFAILDVMALHRSAVVSLALPERLSTTDETAPIPVTWQLRDYRSGSFKLDILKNGQVIDTVTNPAATPYMLAPGKVEAGRVRDVYTVQATVRNTDDPPEYEGKDAFQINVYNSSALQILVNAVAQDSITMQNGYTAGVTTFAQAYAFELSEMLTVDSLQATMNAVEDQMEWSSSNTAVAGVNYKAANALQYQSIETRQGGTYNPYSVLMLTGNGSGTAQIQVTHKATGITDTLQVTVDTLKDKLYLFRFLPGTTTTALYTNGDGLQKEAVSAANGELMIYEENGIVGDVRLKAQNDKGDTLVGAIAAADLKSGEGRAELGERFTLNEARLIQASKVDLYLKNADGTPYTGAITYKSAVYRNGTLCAATVNSGGVDVTPEADGKVGITVDENDLGAALQASDVLEFKFEIIPAASGYYPLLYSLSHAMGYASGLELGHGIVTLRRLADGEKGSPIVVQQTLDYGLAGQQAVDATKKQTAIGPTAAYTAPTVESIVSLWGVATALAQPTVYAESASLKAIGGQAGQSSELLQLPFTDTLYLRNKVTLTGSNLRGAGVADGASSALLVSVYDAAGTCHYRTGTSITLVNLANVATPSADPGFTTDARTMVQGIKDTQQQVTSSRLDTGEKLVNTALRYLDGIQLGTPNMNFTIVATKDPMTYRGVAYLGAGVGDYNGANNFTVEEGDFGMELKVTPSATELFDLVNPIEIYDIISPVRFEYGVSLSGVFEIEVRYDLTAQKWRLVVIGGGYDLNGTIGAGLYMHQSLFSIPIIMSLGVGGVGHTTMRALRPASVPAGSSRSAFLSNDFYNEIRGALYMDAFGGVGFDVSIVALKAGVFGRIEEGVQGRFLSRPYLSSDRQLSDISVDVTGQVGLKAVMKIWFISLEASWTTYSFNKNAFSAGDTAKLNAWMQQQNAQIMSFSADGEMTVAVPEAPKMALESRDYLGNQPFATPQASGGLPTTRYPYSNPVLTRDGALMAFLSDQNSTSLDDTRVMWQPTGGGAASAIDIPASALADSSLALDGTQSHAVAAWVRQREKLPTTLDAEGVAGMLNQTEIYAAVYAGGGWTTTALTNNGHADTAPVVAADGARAIVAWRAPLGDGLGASGELLYDNQGDHIYYSIYSGTGWGTPQLLYTASGGIGAIKGMDMAMDDAAGRACLVFATDTLGDGKGTGYEVQAALIDLNARSELVRIPLTGNGELDENPQVTLVNTGGANRFLATWHNLTAEGHSDILLRAINMDGSLHSAFPASIAAGEAAPNLPAAFRLVRSANPALNHLNILFTANGMDADGNAANTLSAVRFVEASGNIHITTAYEVGASGGTVDHVDAYMDGNTVSAVAVNSTLDATGTVTGTAIRAQEGTLADGFSFATTEPSPAGIAPGATMALPFTVSNTGYSTITRLEVAGLSATPLVFSGLAIPPGEKATLTAQFQLPDPLANLDYTLHATMGGVNITRSGTLRLAVPDLAVGEAQTVYAAEGKRVIQAVIYNGAETPVATETVEMGLYTSPEALQAADAAVEVFTLTAAEVALLNEGKLTKQLTYTLPAGGIPESGQTLYLRVQGQNADGTPLEEHYSTNNEKGVYIPNPVAENGGKPFRVDVVQGYANGVTTAHLTISNLTMQAVSEGILTARLLDADGNQLEELTLPVSDLIGPEGQLLKELTFAQQGASVTAEFASGRLDAAAPVISVDLPAALSIRKGGSATLSVTATAPGGTLSYQWYKDSAPIPAATGASHAIKKATVADAGKYHVVVTNTLYNSSASATSRKCKVAIKSSSPPPASESTYDGADPPQSTAAPQSAARPALTDSTSISATDDSDQPVDDSSIVEDDVDITPTILVDLPDTLAIAAGGSATLAVTASTDAGTLSYAWYYNGQHIADAEEATLAIPNMQAENAGDYHVVVTSTHNGATASATSNTCAVTLLGTEAEPPPPSTSAFPWVILWVAVAVVAAVVVVIVVWRVRRKRTPPQ